MSTTCLLRTNYRDGSECGQPAAYKVYGFDCHACDLRGYVVCAGHPVCPEHAARVRTDSVAQTARASELPAFTVERIHSLNGGSKPDPDYATTASQGSPT